MGWRPKPWYRASKDAWYVQLHGKQVRLAKGKGSRDQAERALHRLLLLEPSERVHDPSFRLLATEFLEHAERTTTPGTQTFYRQKLKQACAVFGHIQAADLKPSHVARLMARYPQWGAATQNGMITVLRACLRFGVREGLLVVDPLPHMKRPAMPQREKTFTDEERESIRAGALDQAFRDLVLALEETGARPGEIMKLEARFINWAEGIAQLPGKTTRATGRPRTLVLTDRMLVMCRHLAKRWPSGALFRNSRGDPWTLCAIRGRFERLRKRLGLDPRITSYVYRHSFVTDALERGVGIATVAALVGHTNVQMTASRYSKLVERRTFLRQEAERALGRTVKKPRLDST